MCISSLNVCIKGTSEFQKLKSYVRKYCQGGSEQCGSESRPGAAVKAERKVLPCAAVRPSGQAPGVPCRERPAALCLGHRNLVLWLWDFCRLDYLQV